MRIITDKCNVCERERTPANHWLLMITPANASPYFIKWNNAQASEDGIGHVCGDKCAHQALEDWLNSQHEERTAARQEENK